MLWFYDQGHLSSVEGEVAKWFAVDFWTAQLVKQKTPEKDIDECPSISGAGKHTQLLISQCRKQWWHGNATAMKKNYDRLDEAIRKAADVCKWG